MTRFNWNNRPIFKDFFALFAAITFFFLVSGIFLFWVRGEVHQYLYVNVDKQLLVIAESIPLILPEDYHLRAKTPDAISKAEYQTIEAKLSALAEASGAKYIWTDIQVDGNVYLTSCNNTPGPNRPEAEIYYFMPYKNGVSAEEMKAFISDTAVFTTFTDLWGHFRAVFVPIKNPDGSVYLACAEFTVDYVHTILRESSLMLMSGLVFFLVGIFPICFLYVQKSRKDKKLLKEKNLQLEQHKEHLRATLHSIGDAVIVTDNLGTICTMNPAAEKLCGWNFSEVEGKPHDEILKFISTDENGNVSSQVNEVLSSKKVILQNRNIGLVTRDNRVIEIIDSAAPIIQKDSGELTGVVLVMRDVTERNRMEEERRQSQKLQSLGQLTGGIAHDINNMLAGISGAIELLEKKVLNEPQVARYISLIKTATERTSDLIRKLLAFSRKGKLINTQVDIHAIIQDTVALVERSIDKRIQLITDLQANRWVVNGDPSQLQNSILNLFLNARDAMPEGGKLRIVTTNPSKDDTFCYCDASSSPDVCCIKISIFDTGTGIKPEEQIKIFEPFYTTKEVGKGTGLGLASVYGVIREHNGMIKFDSEIDKGTVFHICLPLSENSSVPVVVKKDEQVSVGFGTVLMVEDEEFIRDTASLILEQMGYTVLLAHDGAEGVLIYREKHQEIDIIILDVVMPVMNGNEVLDHILKINPAAKVIISSGYAKDVNINNMLRMGAAGYLMKPFNYSELSKIISKLKVASDPELCSE